MEIIVDGKGTTKEISRHSHPEPESDIPTVTKDEQIRNVILKEKSGEINVEKIANDVDVGTQVVKQAIEAMLDTGFGLKKTGESYIRTKVPTGGKIYDARDLIGAQTLRFAIAGDTHLGSEKERLDSLNDFYDICQKEGIVSVFHPGDFTEGVGVYRGQELEVTQIGQQRQIQHSTENYPKRDGIKTYVISGNHDLREYERGGADPLVSIASQRPDIIYLGQITSTVQFADKINMEMLHPAGNVAYALSYKAQRDINNRTPEEIPDILVYGHYHTSFYMRYRGIHFVQAPCFKDQGLFEKRLGLNPTIGGWIVEARLGNDSQIETFKPELFTF